MIHYSVALSHLFDSTRLGSVRRRPKRPPFHLNTWFVRFSHLKCRRSNFFFVLVLVILVVFFFSLPSNKNCNANRFYDDLSNVIEMKWVGQRPEVKKTFRLRKKNIQFANGKKMCSVFNKMENKVKNDKICFLSIFPNIKYRTSFLCIQNILCVKCRPFRSDTSFTIIVIFRISNQFSSYLWHFLWLYSYLPFVWVWYFSLSRGKKMC